MTPEQEKIYEDAFIAGMQKQAQSSVDRAVNAMAQRTWVDLTPQDLNEIFAVAMTGEGAVHLALEKIKEKNNG